MVSEPLPTLTGPSGVTVIPRERRNRVICADGVTVAWPPVTRSVLASAGAATATVHRPVASAHTTVLDMRDMPSPWTGGGAADAGPPRAECLAYVARSGRGDIIPRPRSSARLRTPVLS